jgi:integrase
MSDRPQQVSLDEQHTIWNRVLETHNNDQVKALNYLLQVGTAYIKKHDPQVREDHSRISKYSHDHIEEIAFACIANKFREDAEATVTADMVLTKPLKADSPSMHGVESVTTVPTPMPFTASPQPTTGIKRTSGKSIREVFELYLKANPKKARSDIELLLAIIGDENRAFNTLDELDMSTCIETLTALPKYTTAEKFIEASGEFDHDSEKQAPTTIKPKIQILKGVCRYAKSNTHHSENIGNNIEYKLPPRHKEEAKYNLFTDSQLEGIFNSWVYGTERPKGQSKDGVKDYYFWTPLIGLFTGARLGELIQLRTSDIGSLNGIPYFHITNDDTPKSEDNSNRRTLKNSNSKRKVPIHPQLIEMGFLEYVEYLKANGSTHLFPGAYLGGKSIKAAKSAASKWFSRLTIKIGIRAYADRLHVNHSFRHTLTDNLRQQGVEDLLIKSLTGHTNHMYGKDYNIELRYKALLKFSFNLDLSHCDYAERFVRKLQCKPKLSRTYSRKRPKRSKDQLSS